MHDICLTHRHAQQITIRVALCLHILFYLEEDPDISDVMLSEAVTASINLVEGCCQQTAYLAVRGDISEERERLQEGNIISRCTFLQIPQILVIKHPSLLGTYCLLSAYCLPLIY